MSRQSLNKIEVLQQKRELRLQRELKVRHSEMKWGLRYSVSYFRQYPPEAVERKWKEDIENLKRIIEQYDDCLNEMSENHK